MQANDSYFIRIALWTLIRVLVNSSSYLEATSILLLAIRTQHSGTMIVFYWLFLQNYRNL